ncbi:MAG: hypothetical protein ACI8W8_001090 [Rhodothermales bacterium]|jgi:hypothetical protein
MSSQLSPLRKGLARVRALRSTVRLGSAFSLALSIILWILLAAFALDVLAHMGKLERVIILVVTAVAIVRSFTKLILPALATKESEIDIALLVESKQGISSELVAALQFEDSNRSQFGSDSLRDAVVADTAKIAPSLDYLDGFSRAQLRRNLIIFSITVVVTLIPVIATPRFVDAFADRFVLGDAHYPTGTVIVEVVSPGTSTAYGRPVEFVVRLDGKIPADGHVELRSLTSGISASIPLAPSETDPTLFVGTLSRALEPLSYTIFVGDAYTEPVELSLVPLPRINVDFEVTTPEYARAKFADQQGRRRAILEGSRVIPVVTADKPLRSSQISIDDTPHAMTLDGERYVLDAADGPFAMLSTSVRYAVQVEDQDGLSLDQPVSGMLQVRPDQAPRIAAASVTRYVLPAATPRIKYKALDDYALGSIRVHKIVQRLTATPEVGEDAKEPEAPIIAEIARIEDHADSRSETVRIDLADLNLVKGDRVIVTFEAIDYGGEAEPKSGSSQALIFHVSDRAGVLSAMRELDNQLDKKLDQIIHAQLGMR